jgi:hypothetical protein
MVTQIFWWDKGKLRMRLERFTLLMIPRGFSKTTLAGIAFPLYNIVFQELKFAVYISATASHAEQQLANQKRQLESNPRILHVFGNLKPTMQDSASWRQEIYETTTGMVMRAAGRGGQVRGMNHNGQRPRLGVVDDLEELDLVQTPEQRQKTKRWVYSDLLPILPAMDPDAGFVVLGTLLHNDSLLMTLSDDPQWNVVRFGAYDKQGDLLWPENMDEAKLEREKQSAVLSNTLSEYYMERFSIIRDARNADFKEEYIKFGGPTQDEQLFTTLYCDPAISEKPTADHCTFSVVAMSTKARIYVRKSTGQIGMSPRDVVNQMFRLYAEYRPDRVGIESNAYQMALVHLMREEMFRRKLYFEVIPVNNSKKKAMRVKGILQPRYAAGVMYHEGRFVELETQLLQFPNSKKDDYADGLAGAVSLLDDAASMAEDGGVTGQEAPDLEDVIGGDWRQAV